MVSSTYKNMLAVCRSSQNQSTKTLLRDHYNFWFAEDLPPFSFTSPNDKVIIFYPNMITTNQEDIVTLEDNSTFTPTEIADGALQFLSDKTMIKIIGCKFKTNELLKSSLSLFREYLMKGVKNLNLTDYNQYKFAIFWDEKLLNGEVLPIIKETGLLTDNNNFSHVFSAEELKGGPPPKYVPEVNFGLNTLGQSTPSIFGTQSSTNPTQSLFSNQSTTATSTPSLFGASTTTNPTQSLFSNQSATATSTPSPFGASTTNPSPFGASTTPSPFGASTTNPSPFGASTTPSPFGASTTTNPSPFGASTTPSPFGASTITNPSPFGASTTTPSPFGTQSNNVFSNGATQKNNQFGFNNNSFSTFGTQQNNNVFGKKPTKSGSNWWK
jgi:hypothetical protein